MNRDRLNEFLVLSKTLSFTKASQKLYIAQSVLSRHIIELESELGVDLFERNSHNVTLTEAGKFFSRDAEKLIRKNDEALDRLRNSELATVGNCRILCSEGVLSPLLVEFIRNFNEKYTDTHTIIDIYSEENIFQHINDYDITISLLDLSLSNSNIPSVVPYVIEPCLVLPLNISLIHSHEAKLKELQGKTLIVPTYPDSTLDSFSIIKQLVEKYTAKLINVLNVPNIESALLNVDLGNGLTIIPKHMSRDIYEHSRIVNISNSDCYFNAFTYFSNTKNNGTAMLFYKELLNIKEN